MKNLLALFILSLSSLAVHASDFQIDMKCGEVKKVRSGKLLRRLEPNLFGLNSKFVLTTVFENGMSYTESGTSEDNIYVNSQVLDYRSRAYTDFSLKYKFIDKKTELKKELRKANRDNRTLYACVGYVRVNLLKYMGSNVFYSYESMQDARMKMRRQALRHL